LFDFGNHRVRVLESWKTDSICLSLETIGYGFWKVGKQIQCI